MAALNSAALNDPAPPVRIAATEALGMIDPDSASNALIHLAGDHIDELAAAAVTALADVRSADGRAAEYIRAARDERRIVRLAAIAVLAAAPDNDTRHRYCSVSPQPTTNLTSGEPLSRRSAMSTVRQDPVGDEAVQMLVAMLIDGERGQEAAAALGAGPARRTARERRRSSHHPDAMIRRAIVDMLGHYRHSEATTLLVDALNDKAAAVRDAATLALGRRRHV